MPTGALFLISLTVLFLCFAGTAFAADYYVAPSGDDVNPGTSPTQAWKTLTPVNAKTFAPGDRLLFQAGSRYTGQLKPQGSGVTGHPIIIDQYGEGSKPRFDGAGQVMAAVLLYNVDYWEVNNLEVTNTIADPKPGRLNGVLVHLKDFGSAYHVVLRNLYVHDVSGCGGHGSESGDGIAWLNEGETTKSRFEGLLIEGCRLERIYLNGIWGWSRYWERGKWYPSYNVVIRNNVLEEIGMSGIVPVGCDGALVEHNRVVRPSRSGSGIGVWPWSCDNTVIQFNEVTGTDGAKDSQAFDSDWNCRNSVFQYNYSHDNKGGFILICTQGINAYNLGCQGTIVRYNISENDGGTATQIVCIAGPCKDTYIYNNTFYTGPDLKINLVEHWDWDGWASNTHFYNNVFYADGLLRFVFGESTNNVFNSNGWYGNFEKRPDDTNAITEDPKLTRPGQGGTIGDTHKLDTLTAYRLQASSPLIDKGRDLREVFGVNMGAHDFYGEAIPVGAGYDIGAHEYGTAAERPIRILPLGDSITQQDEPGYRYLLWKRLLDAGKAFDFVGSRGIPEGKKLSDWPQYKGRSFDADHDGHAGWRSSELLDGCSWEPDKGNLSQWLRLYTPDVVLLHIGTNDVFQGMSTDESVEQITKIIGVLQAANPKVTVYLAKIIPLCGAWADDFNQEVTDLNNRLDAVAAGQTTAESKVYIVDQHTGFDPEKDTDDDIHPNAVGAQKMADRWAEALLYDGTPQARGDTYRAVVNQPLEVEALAGVLTNDFALGHPMQAELFGQPVHGKFTLNPDGSFRYESKRGFAAVDSFSYQAKADGKVSAECRVRIDVIDNAPVASDDRFYLAQDTKFTVDTAAGVLCNDVVYRKHKKAVLLTPPTKGHLTFKKTGAFTYTPEQDFIGTDTFQYRVDDGVKKSGTATVNLLVGHSAPIAWWRLDEKEGVTAQDTASGKLDGTLTNMEANSWIEDGGLRALRFDGINDYVSLPPLNASTEAMTFTAWVKRDGVQPIFAGIVFSSEGNSLAGLGLGTGPAWSPNYELGYLWNRKYWNWHSGLVVPDGEWCLVALVVTPSQATLYLGYGDKVSSATKVGKHEPEKFTGGTRIGQNAEKDNRFFKGLIRDVRIYDRPLSAKEIGTLYESGKRP